MGTVGCKSCGARLNLPEELGVAPCKCARCGAVFVAAGPVPPPPSALLTATPAAPGPLATAPLSHEPAAGALGKRVRRPEGKQTGRAVLLGPVACAVIGCSAGLCLAMLYHPVPQARAQVYGEDALPLMAAGAALGCLAGLSVLAACRRRPGAVRELTLLVMTMLGAAAAAPPGWIIGDRGVKRLAREGMAFGAGVGATSGLALAVLRLLVDGHARRARPSDPEDRPRG